MISPVLVHHALTMVGRRLPRLLPAVIKWAAVEMQVMLALRSSLGEDLEQHHSRPRPMASFKLGQIFLHLAYGEDTTDNAQYFRHGTNT